MAYRGFLAASCATLAITVGVNGEAAQERSMDLPALVARLDLTEGGARRWLEQLGVTSDEASTERLMAVSVTGAPLLEREGGGSSVRIDPELDTLLLRSDMAIVLVHNHPANVGLSGNDLRQLTKPGIAPSWHSATTAACSSPQPARAWTGTFSRTSSMRWPKRR